MRENKRSIFSRSCGSAAGAFLPEQARRLYVTKPLLKNSGPSIKLLIVI